MRVVSQSSFHYFHSRRNGRRTVRPLRPCSTPRASQRIHAPHTPALTQSNSLCLCLSLSLSRSLAVSLCRYFELFQIFDGIDQDDDRRIDIDEFTAAAPQSLLPLSPSSTQKNSFAPKKQTAVRWYTLIFFSCDMCSLATPPPPPRLIDRECRLKAWGMDISDDPRLTFDEVCFLSRPPSSVS